MSGAVVTLGPPTVGAAGASDQGRVRRSNEDRFHIDTENGIFLVADGVGGRAAGEVASAIAADVIADCLPRLPGSPGERIRQAIALANNEIHRQAQASAARHGMTCVLTLAVLNGHRLTIGHVGDSRLYMITSAGIAKMTRDHSPVGEQEDNREISEEQAMRHPRRNEVFRDVGTMPHGPDDPEFVDIVETSFDQDSAIVLCSDGLSDMLPSAAIERVVRHHAGRPAAVADALVDAANEAGGHDNITVVYAEGAGFAHSRAEAAAPVETLRKQPSRGASRLRWLAAGGVLGMLAAAALVATLDLLPVTWRGRTLVVGGTATGYASIADAMAAAGPRDIVQVEPGTYQEEIVLGDGVALRASVPGSVTLAAPPGRTGWVSLTSRGTRGNIISGLRILGSAEAPIAFGLKLEGTGSVAVDDVTLEGNIDVGIDVQNDGASVVRASRFQQIRGLPLRIAGTSQPVVRQNLFVRGAHESGPAVHVQDRAQPSLEGNLFVGFAEAIGAAPSQREHLARGNYLIRASDRPSGQRSTP